MRLLKCWLSLPAIAVATTALAGTTTVRVALEGAYPPFIAADAHGEARGISADYLAAVAHAAGLTLSYGPPSTLPEALRQVRQGEADLVTSVTWSAERAEFLGFSEPYVRVPAVLLLPPARQDIHGLAQLAGQRVAVGNGYAVEAFLRRHYPQLMLVPVRDDAAALQAVAQQQADGAVMDMASARWLMARAGNDSRPRVAGEIGFEYALAFATRRDNAALLRVIDAQLEALTPATRQSIMERWTPRSEERLPAWLIASGLLAALLLTITLVTALRQRLRAATTAAPGALQ